MAEGIIEKLTGVLTEPSEFFKKAEKDKIEDAVKYYAVMLLVPAVLFAISFSFFFSFMEAMMPVTQPGMFMGALGPLFGIGIGIFIYIAGLIGSFISAAILYVFAYILSVRKGYEPVYKAYTYGHTPALLLSWLPLINIVGALWSWFLTVKGLSVLCKTTMGRAFLITLLPIIVAAVILGLFWFSLFSAFARLPY